MLRQKAVLELKINERLYSLELANESPLGEVYDALTMLRSYVIDRMNQENEASKSKNIEEKPAE